VPMTRAQTTVLLASLALGALACDRPTKKDPGPEPPAGRSVADAPAAKPPAKRPGCTRLPGAPALAIGRLTDDRLDHGATSEEEPLGPAEPPDTTGPLAGVAVEFARAAEDGPSFLLGLLQHEAESRAGVAVLDAPGSARYLDLGRVEAAAEPPRVAARAGHWLALVIDPTSAGSVLRLFGIVRQGGRDELRLGPELRKGRRDPGSGDLAVLPNGRALLVWDREGPKGLPEVAGFEVDARSLKPRSAPFVLSSPGEPASEPRLFATDTGYWLLWLAETPGAEGTEVDSEAGLLAEPPAVLFVSELDGAGRSRGPAVALNRDEPAALVLDARVLPSGHLLVAHRLARADRPTDDQPIHLSTLGPGGTVTRREISSDQLRGPGAPSILGRAGQDPSWLALEDSGGEAVLARLLPDGTARVATGAGLGGRVALAGDPRRLLTAEPRGIGVELEILTCTLD
jgi:hypothetical protein